MLVGHDGFYMLLRQYRTAWFSGRVAVGKTSLCFRLAYDLVVKNKYRHIVSNIYSVWCDPLEDVKLLEDGMLKTVIIVDEGGLF